jgi:hypothetical protein
LIIDACYSWETALKLGLDVSFDNWKLIQVGKKGGEVNSRKAYITNLENLR